SLQPQINSSKQLTVKYVPPSRPFKYSKKNFECHKIVLVKYSPGAESQLKECPAEKLLQILIPDAWISPLPHHSQQFLTWLAKTKFYELTYSDNGIAVAKFKELLKV
ncbi:MAG TPA: hypothetical protein VKZ98_10345, partial [Aquaticitalea sp.]|nr:hypothetical protein [Aquaticitalea sp.]